MFGRHRKNDLTRLDSSLNEALNAAKCVQGAAVNDTVIDFLVVCEHIYERASDSQMIIEVRIIDAEYLIGSKKSAWRRNTSGCVAQTI